MIEQLSRWATEIFEETAGDGVLIAGTKDFELIKQTDGYSCGGRCVQMLLKHFGAPHSFEHINEVLKCKENDGTTTADLATYLDQHGYDVHISDSKTLNKLSAHLADERIVIVCFYGTHWAIAHGITDKAVLVADPSRKKRPRKMTYGAFLYRWDGTAIAAKPR